MESEPYITVGKDAHGSACWIVIGNGCRFSCATGHRALEIMTALIRSAGADPPTR